jgi:hypothetical protein
MDQRRIYKTWIKSKSVFWNNVEFYIWNNVEILENEQKMWTLLVQIAAIGCKKESNRIHISHVHDSWSRTISNLTENLQLLSIPFLNFEIMYWWTDIMIDLSILLSLYAKTWQAWIVNSKLRAEGLIKVALRAVHVAPPLLSALRL